ncbi:chemotaxis protein [Lachnoanaerobaculum gingivalis]|uniref:Chemotaxis protein n=1 Tax=Lachnoanaerobaculum gingivalis TaxID=2490855 RepID=A0A3P3QVJ2_9FIRM|nr:chemotaxis protein [Lachnoanaerobaculum gingivalis]RRJ25277.1 chemotaxis protein [Lachnoanaerobaculum gingivalis]
MYRVGFIDDDRDSYEDYRVRLARKDIELLYPDCITEMPEIIEWLLSNSIKCLIIDYKLNNKFKFLGTELIAYINVKVPDLPCLILTNYPEESIRENLVIINLIEDRNVLAEDDIEGFARKIKQAVDVFENRLHKYYINYEELLKARKNGSISAIEEEQFIDLYKLLRAYGEVDDLPIQLLSSEVNQKIDEILGRVNVLVEEVENR